MAKEAFLPLFCGDFLASTAEWPGEARSLYVTALMYQWVNPLRSLPADPDALRSLIGWSEAVFDRWWPRVAPKFEVRGDRLVNARLEQHRERTHELSKRRSEAGRKGAAVTNSKSALPNDTGGNAAAKPTRYTGNAAAQPNGKAVNAAQNGAALPTPNPPFAANFAASSIPSHPIPSQSIQESDSQDSTGLGRARARRAAKAAKDEDRARRMKIPGAGSQVTDESETRRKALTLLESGMSVGSVAKALRQYGVTADQVTQWQREAANAGR